MHEKCQISRAFGRAASQYDILATFQRNVCEHMACYLPEILPNKPIEHILDGGCGTGFGAICLNILFPQAQISCVDLSQAMVEHCRTRGFHAQSGDIEQLTFAENSFDLYFTSLAIQWCNPLKVFSEARRVLNHNGLFYFSTLAPGSLPEISEAFSTEQSQANMLNLSDISVLKNSLEKVGFKQISVNQQKRVMYYPDATSAMNSIRGIGANGIARSKTYFGKNNFINAMKKLEAKSTPQGIPISYELIIGSAINFNV